MSCFFKQNRFYPQNIFFAADDKISVEQILFQLSEEASSLAPEYFDAETKYFVFKFRYYPPYTKVSEFPEMKRLQTEAISKTRFKDEYRGFIAIDISEWVKHSNDEHFENCLLFLNDMSEYWKYIFFTVGDFSEYETSETLETLKKHIWLTEINSDHFEASDFVRSLCKEMSNKYKTTFSSSVQSLLAYVFKERKGSDIALISTLAKDISRFFNDKKHINSHCIYEYLRDNSTFAHFIMSEKELAVLNNYITEKGSK